MTRVVASAIAVVCLAVCWRSIDNATYALTDSTHDRWVAVAIAAGTVAVFACAWAWTR
ncbi:MAG: hypothetical protein H6515_12985 [Microthrixaceae bacterium]|nr:hypothetical protein [Microthrixaceae bacterium]